MRKYIIFRSEFGVAVICYCQFKPVESEIKPMPDRIVSIDLFSGDKERYKEWQENNPVPV